MHTGHDLSPFFVAAKAKNLPSSYFRDIIAARGNVRVRFGEWPSFQPSSGGSTTISHPKVGKPFTEWGSLDWSSFYNELYHAWWASRTRRRQLSNSDAIYRDNIISVLRGFAGLVSNY